MNTVEHLGANVLDAFFLVGDHNKVGLILDQN